MSFCDTLCIFCFEKGTISVNLSGYHKTCRNHYEALENKIYVNCQHCTSQLLLCKNILSCIKCKNNKIKSNFPCGHNECKICLKTCSLCNFDFCSICYEYLDHLCVECDTTYCMDCRKSKKTCKICKLKKCDCACA